MNAAIEAFGLDMRGSGGAGGGVESLNNTTNPASPGSNSTGSGGFNTSGTKNYPPKYLTGVQVATYLYKAGFRGKDLVDMVAIAGRESRFNANAFNPKNRDLSYGLMQINMKGDMGPKRRKDFGISKNEDLLNPTTNAKAAWIVSGGGNNFKPWAKREWNYNHLHETDVPAATSHVKKAGYKTTGDPTLDMGGYQPTNSGTSTVVMQGDSGNTFHVSIAPTINLNGGNNYGADVQKLSKEVSSLLEREVKLLMLRST
jgi:hypothetical protein